ncbi:MAG: four helix bundle protein [Thermoleophilia bacterium]|nr:four helix bundle protein [Thermoleophilia bacterium]
MDDSIASLEPHEPNGPEVPYAARRAVERLVALATHVDRLAGKFPLKEHTGLRSQMRRAAMDALAGAACALEAISVRDYHALMLRSLGALSELDTFARLGQRSGAVTPTEAAHVGLLVQLAGHEVRLSLNEPPFSLLGAA